MFLFYFFSWTLMLYWIHRIAHKTPVLQKIHWHHHRYINGGPPTKWHWNNLLLINDDVISTLDLWISEVIPTIVFSYLTGQLWIFVFYYLWAALIQESIEHNRQVDIKWFTSGQWHLIHHRRPDKNFGLFFPIWDWVFGSYTAVK